MGGWSCIGAASLGMTMFAGSCCALDHLLVSAMKVNRAGTPREVFFCESVILMLLPPALCRSFLAG